MFLIGTSGNAAVDIERRLCVIDNVNNGVDIYKIDSGNFVQTLVTQDPIKTYPKGVAFANHSQAIVGGSDHGLAYIFECKSGQMITTLNHGNNEGVQTIGVSVRLDNKAQPSTDLGRRCKKDRDDIVIIATALSSTSGPSVIRLWLWKPFSNDGREKWSNQRWGFARGLKWILKLLITMAAVAYIIELFRGEVGD